MSDHTNINLINSALKTLSLLRSNADDFFRQALDLPQLSAYLPNYEEAEDAKTKNLQTVLSMIEKLDQTFKYVCLYLFVLLIMPLVV